MSTRKVSSMVRPPMAIVITTLLGVCVWIIARILSREGNIKASNKYADCAISTDQTDGAECTNWDGSYCYKGTFDSKTGLCKRKYKDIIYCLDVFWLYVGFMLLSLGIFGYHSSSENQYLGLGLLLVFYLISLVVYYGNNKNWW